MTEWWRVFRQYLLIALVAAALASIYSSWQLYADLDECRQRVAEVDDFPPDDQPEIEPVDPDGNPNFDGKAMGDSDDNKG